MRTFFLLTLATTTLVFSSCSRPPEGSIEIPTALAADVGEIAAKSRIVDLSVLVDEDVPAHFGPIRLSSVGRSIGLSPRKASTALSPNRAKQPISANDT